MSKTPDQLRREAEEMLAFDMGLRNALPHMEVREETPKARDVLSDKGAKHIVSMVFKSSNEGDPHVVTLRHNYDGTALVRCTCLAAEDAPCWAVNDFRRVTGL